ncbi:L,D-transpeptidase catalytic domain [Cognatiyoonia koreensis]|uniref:L,D-transpeptidase catalytic domain n=1 Tax=Cognatiyoonia koreensis TaxID=364200 RepID=A0A1I0RUK4_9RHOB|nr:L,D-transpeptidase [Cognatiyoonia koreensis]SEW45118.1 L,D-transpeptidase catalytic domain [Cognatiyoonia koreensis]
MKRRDFLTGFAACTALSSTADAGNIYDRHIVTMNRSYPAGQIHVNTTQRFLYLTTGGNRALRYGVAVGAAGREFRGQATISRKAMWPSWRPTQNMIRQEPAVYGPFRAGLPGRHPQNPMGAAALYLAQGGHETFYRIHGTHQPWSIGQGFSSGCVRLTNENVTDLYQRVRTGTQVFVT